MKMSKGTVHPLVLNMRNVFDFDLEPVGRGEHIQQSGAHVLEKFTFLFVLLRDYCAPQACLHPP